MQVKKREICCFGNSLPTKPDRSFFVAAILLVAASSMIGVILWN